MAGWLTFAATTSSITISSALIGTHVSFPVGSGLAATFKVGAPIIASNGGDGAQASGIISGTVVSYSGSTLVVNISAVNGTATVTSWSVLAGGVWQCTTGLSATMNWTQIGSPNLDNIASISGDMNNYGKVYTANYGSGFSQINLP